MTTIKTSCPVCGDVELTPEQMRLVVCSRSDWSFYAFRCDTCTTRSASRPTTRS